MNCSYLYEPNCLLFIQYSYKCVDNQSGSFLWFSRIICSVPFHRSDVLGHLLPMVGKDWSQVGIASLYNMIERNGYRFMYLSARSIGHSRITRDYIRNIRQGDLTLPDGPLLLSPGSLIQAFHKYTTIRPFHHIF